MKCFAVLFMLLTCVSGFALDRRAFTFTNYDLEVRIEPEQQRLAARGTITLRNDSDAPQKSLVLQVSSTLDWVSIRLDSKPVQFLTHTYTSDIDHTGALSEAIVTLAAAVSPKQTVQLEIGYEGIVPQDLTRLTRSGVPDDVAKHSDWDRVSPSFTAVRGIGYVAWYPIATEAVEISDGAALSREVGRWKHRHAGSSMAVNLCVTGQSEPAMPVMNDAQPGVSPAPQNLKSPAPPSCGIHSFSPLGSTVPIIALGNYSRIQKSGMQLYYLPDDQSGSDNYALALEQASTLLNKLFASVAISHLAQAIDLDDPEAEPFQSANTSLVPFRAKDSTLLLSAVEQLTSARFPSPQTWIRGGLARFAQLALLKERSGPQEANAVFQSQADSLRLFEKQNAEAANSGENSLINSPDESYVQAKAASVWWMLRDIAGETAFKSALSNYKPAEDKDSSYIQRLLEAQTHTDLAWFFEDWVYRDRGLPDLKIDSVYPRNLGANGYLVTVTVENLGNAGAEIPVIVHMEQGEASEKLVVPRKSKASVRLTVPGKPVEVTVSDGSVPEADMSNNSYKLQNLSSTPR